jgi:hypothetical protein
VADDPRAELIASMVELSNRVRHPNLSLDHFVSDSFEFEDDDQEKRLAGLPAAEIELAKARRGSVALAADQIIDRCIEDLQEIPFDDEGMPDPELAEESFVYEVFPQRHRRAYNQLFFRKVLVTVVKVAQDIADPHGPAAACTAEEIVRQAVGHAATTVCELVDLEEPEIYLDDALLEDLDFENLFDDMDGIADDPARQAAMGLEIPGVENWFSPFNDHYIVHPYAQTDPVDTPAVHDLFDRVDDLDAQKAILDSAFIDSPEPLVGLRAASEVVDLARRAALGEGADPTLWVADASDPEGSFAELVAASASEYGSGWLTWEPYENADIIRTDPVVSLEPHRHFPVGDDQPWIWAAVGGGRLLAIPLDVVVSYRPDPDVRRRWNDAFSFLGDDDDA